MPTATASRESKAGRPPDTRHDAAILLAAVELPGGHGFVHVIVAAVAERARTSDPNERKAW